MSEAIGDPADDERIVINMGPQHPSTHGVLRLVLELQGETVTQARSVIGYLHTGIEKNMEYRTWTQGVTFVTRMDYLGPLFNETAYCLAVEKLLGVTAPPRAQLVRVLLMELNRISSHLVYMATGGMELGSSTAMTYGFRERETVLHLLEQLTGLRMNHAFIRPGGVAQDLPANTEALLVAFIAEMKAKLPEYDTLLTGQPIWRNRLEGVGYLPLDGCLALGVTGPVLRSAGLAWDLRKVEPYCGYEDFEFDVPTATEADCLARYLLRVQEMHESLGIVEQCIDKLRATAGEPVMVADKSIAWPAQLSVGSDGLGNSLEHVKKIMGQSMESLIHHFKLVTEGFRVPPGQVYSSIESPRGELGVHLVSDGGTRPLRAHVREPSFVNLQAMPAMSEGGLVADVIASIASIDPVMGGVDR
ncbi:NADH-quinone oxidoreductase subunit D [Rhodococcus antarcticus]|uniref:NADH-quinone oxidoreductase subunit D n=1 Tax=Rhodococcus antarcticus TaxID=2987751 RepID=A0ABY6P5N1_9NOCA|nr:NADH-quinone oxidoreductase subunit D [Rhodococcus antarcticus]UZJ26794.1 NADH-quinone oxidoreductase subunit D [Rhodococcus antarcticus]